MKMIGKIVHANSRIDPFYVGGRRKKIQTLEKKP